MAKPSASIQHFELPFINVHEISFFGGNLGNQLESLLKWFPSMRALMLNNVQMDVRNISMPFDNLRMLSIDVNDGIRCNHGLTRTDAIHLFNLCKELIKLEIRTLTHHGMDMAPLLDLIKDNRKIRQLIVSMDKVIVGIRSWEMQRLASEYPNLLELDLQNFKFSAETAIKRWRSSTQFVGEISLSSR